MRFSPCLTVVKGDFEMDTSKILVTGGTGTLGSLVVDRLTTLGHEVKILSHSGRPGTIQGNLLTGEGLASAVADIDVIVHCASSSGNPRQVDGEGTKRLLQAAEQAGVSHIVFISIVGVDRNLAHSYYRTKFEVEQMIERSAIPWTILRATQFHDFVLTFMQLIDRLPIIFIPKGVLLQPIQTAEVADRLVELALSPPAGHVPDIGGPEIWTVAELARVYFQAIERRKIIEVSLPRKASKAFRSGAQIVYFQAIERRRKIIEIPLPGKVSQAFRSGAHLCPDQKYGKVRWEEFLNQKFCLHQGSAQTLMSTEYR
jgi:uncharacterized protein YbjT (DUF2867 family)